MGQCHPAWRIESAPRAPRQSLGGSTLSGYGDEVESDEDVGGAFYVEDPRFPMAAMHNTAVRIIGVDGKPQQYEEELKLERGNIVVFPAWLRHGVRPYTGKRERASLLR